MIGSRLRRVLLVALGFAVVLLAACANAYAQQPAITFDGQIKPFLATYCVGCHGPTKQKGERRFDELKGEIADDNGLIDWQDILDQLNLGEMPPAKEPKQPTDAERKKIVAWLTTKIDQYRRERKPAAAQAVLRRLNAREY